MLAPLSQTDRQIATPPEVPWSWYYACDLPALARGPVGIAIGGRQFVVFRTAKGAISALERRCVHLRADLALGHVEGECLHCPLHDWRYDAAGRCVGIPAASEIPPFARQQAYPTHVLGPHVFIFNRPEATFPFPFFEECDPTDFFPAKPIVLKVALAWPMVAANGFDVQHFRTAHDRTLLEEPTLREIGPFAQQISGRFRVSGRGPRDVLTRLLSGSEMRMTVTSWLGTIVHARAAFARTTSNGMVCVRPIDAEHSELRTIVWLPRRSSLLGRTIVDPVDAVARRWFIREFMRDDQRRSEGTRYNPHSLIAADAALGGYLEWLSETATGETF